VLRFLRTARTLPTARWFLHAVLRLCRPSGRCCQCCCGARGGAARCACAARADTTQPTGNHVGRLPAARGWVVTAVPHVQRLRGHCDILAAASAQHAGWLLRGTPARGAAKAAYAAGVLLLCAAVAAARTAGTGWLGPALLHWGSHRPPAAPQARSRLAAHCTPSAMAPHTQLATPRRPAAPSTG
jgi:hypothetical protein